MEARLPVALGCDLANSQTFFLFTAERYDDKMRRCAYKACRSLGLLASYASGGQDWCYREDATGGGHGANQAG
jgi:hypothetical protein